MLFRSTCVLVEDCNDDLGGFAYLDDCGECVGGNTGNVANYTMDECGLCDGPGYIEWYIDADGDNLGYGDGVPFCSDVVPDGYVPNNDDTEPYCATNDTDECGLCGGNGSEDGYDCDGNCTAGYDCNNICGGSDENDECGICAGDNSTCTDCNGDVNGGAYVDGCSDCVGGNTGIEACPLDCNGVDGGSAWNNACGECVDEEGASCVLGCDGNWSDDGNELENDDCGVCNGDNSTCSGCMDNIACNYSPDAIIEDINCTYPDEEDYDCLGNCVIQVDCMGVCGGSAPVDACDICNGPGASTWYGDSDGDGFGDPNVVLDSCDAPNNYVPNDDDEYPDCGANYFDCTGECGGDGIEDECGICEGDNSSCADECGVPNGDNSSCIDECGVINGNGYFDDCGICDSDTSNDCECDYFDNCGVCNGDNTDCWFIDITTGIGSVGEIVDGLSRIGMHEAAADDFNADYIPEYNCENCYKDELEIEFTNPSNWIDFYFPHPEWEEEIHDFIFNGSTNLRKDIRHLETFTLADLDNNSTIFVNEKIYYIQQEWDIMIETDQNISSLPFGENFVKLDFNFENQIPNSDGFTKVFFYKEISGIGEMEEITTFGGSSDPTCFSDYCIKLDDYDLLSNFRIILGTDTVQPSARIVSPLPNEIFALEDDNFLIELEFDNPEMIADLELFFEVNGEISNAISVYVDQFVNVPKNNYYEFLNDQITGDFIESVNIYIEIIDVAGSTVNDHPSGEYHNEMGPLTFSRNESNIDLESGWHLLSTPLTGNHIFDNMFDYTAYDCSDGCTPVETASSGTGFYVRSYGETSLFSGEVLTQFSSTLKQGWNLTGNPLVNSVDINSVILTYNNTDYNWPDAAKYGIISPTPIIYDNENGGHIGTSELSTAAGFWMHSFYDDVEISFIPSNPSPGVEAKIGRAHV